MGEVDLGETCNVRGNVIANGDGSSFGDRSGCRGGPACQDPPPTANNFKKLWKIS